MVGNDVSVCDLQCSGLVGIGMDLFVVKSQDCIIGLGFWIVIKDEFLYGFFWLCLVFKVNGEVCQDGMIEDMIWDVG